MRSLVLSLVLLATFGSYSVMVLTQHGFSGILQVVSKEPWALQMLLDLGVSMGLISLWLVPDAKQRGISPWPWVAISLVFGSISPLCYLVYREIKARVFRESVATT